MASNFPYCQVFDTSTVGVPDRGTGSGADAPGSLFKPGGCILRQRPEARATAPQDRTRRGVADGATGARTAAALRPGTEHRTRKGFLEHYAHNQAKALAAYNASNKAVERRPPPVPAPTDESHMDARMAPGHVLFRGSGVLRWTNPYRSLY